MNPIRPLDPYREACEYANEAIATAQRRFRELALEPPPSVPGSGNMVELAEAASRVERYYDALIIYDPLRAVVLVPFHTVVEIDLDRIKTAKDLLAWVLALLGKTPHGWTPEAWNKACFIRQLVKRIGRIKGWPWVEDYCWLL